MVKAKAPTSQYKKSTKDVFTHFGTVYSRNPLNGEPGIFGTLYSFTDNTAESIAEISPATRKQLNLDLRKLEKAQKFVVEAALLYNNDTGKYIIKFSKKAKVASHAYPKALLDLVHARIITEKEMINAIPLDIVGEWYADQVIITPELEPIAQGEVITYGGSSGKIIFTRQDAQKYIKKKIPFIWVIGEVTTEDLQYFHFAKGLVLTRSGATSHAAVVAKGLGIPAVLGCAELLQTKFQDAEVTIDAREGKIYAGKLKTTAAQQSEGLPDIIRILKRHSQLRIMANADNEVDADRSLTYGADGIGLCRTEHMFFSDNRTQLIRDILFTEHPNPNTLMQLRAIQTEDFYEILKVESGKEVIIRYLDAPLHEFTPAGAGESSREQNPMLGFRGARMLLKKPEIIRVQTQAICDALHRLQEHNIKLPHIGLELPLAISVEEVKIFHNIIQATLTELDVPKSQFKIGVMIETPRAALLINEIAPLVDFISFGTNDLTQMLLGLSRDDTRLFMEDYIKLGILARDPFTSLDKAVAELVLITSRKAKQANPRIKVSLCGEQAGDPDSIATLIKSKVDTISCSPARIPLALLAAARYSLL